MPSARTAAVALDDGGLAGTAAQLCLRFRGCHLQCLPYEADDEAVERLLHGHDGAVDAPQQAGMASARHAVASRHAHTRAGRDVFGGGDDAVCGASGRVYDACHGLDDQTHHTAPDALDEAQGAVRLRAADGVQHHPGEALRNAAPQLLGALQQACCDARPPAANSSTATVAAVVARRPLRAVAYVRVVKGQRCHAAAHRRCHRRHAHTHTHLQQPLK
jgi:hypothetical protein